MEQIAEFIEQKGRLIEQNEQLIQQNKQLLAKDVRSEEEKAEYRSKIAVLEQRISDLERSKKLNSSNSSKPPSSDGLSKETVEKKPKRTNSLREKSDRKPGGQPGHAGTTLKQVDNPDQIIEHIPNQCPGCSATLSKSDAVKFSSRQVFDIPDPSPLIVTEHRGYTCQCKGCGQGVPMLGVFSGFDSFTGNLRFCWLSVAHTVMQVSWTSGQTYSRAPRTDFIPAMCPCALLVLMSAYAGTG